jgi:hypothetical protein
VGWFHPNELGDKLMPAATGVAVAMRESRENGRDFLTDPDIASAFDQERALELELRGPDGAVIGTEIIAIVDTHHLLALADRELKEAEAIEPLSAEDEAAIEEWLADREPEEPWVEPEEFPRYQIQAHLVDHNAIP